MLLFRKMSFILKAFTLITSLCSVVAFQNCSPTTTSNPNDNSQLGGTNSNSSSSVAGNYKVVSYTCGSKNLLGNIEANGATLLNFEVEPFTSSISSAREYAVYSNSCSLQTLMSVSNPTTSSLEISIGNTSCSGTCSASQCSAINIQNVTNSPTVNYNYTIAGSSLNLSHLLTAADVSNSNLIFGSAGCLVGDNVVMTLNSQNLDTNSNASFIGRWTSICSVNSLYNSSTEVSYNLQSDGEVTALVETFSNTTCSGNTYLYYTLSGQYSILGTSPNVPSASVIHFNWSYPGLLVTYDGSRTQYAGANCSSAVQALGFPSSCFQSAGIPSSALESLNSGFAEVISGKLYFGNQNQSTIDLLLPFSPSN